MLRVAVRRRARRDALRHRASPNTTAARVGSGASRCAPRRAWRSRSFTRSPSAVRRREPRILRPRLRERLCRTRGRSACPGPSPQPGRRSHLAIFLPSREGTASAGEISARGRRRAHRPRAAARGHVPRLDDALRNSQWSSGEARPSALLDGRRNHVQWRCGRHPCAARHSGFAGPVEAEVSMVPVPGAASLRTLSSLLSSPPRRPYPSRRPGRAAAPPSSRHRRDRQTPATASVRSRAVTRRLRVSSASGTTCSR